MDLIYSIHATLLAHHNQTGLQDAVVWPSPQKGEGEQNKSRIVRNTEFETETDDRDVSWS